MEAELHLTVAEKLRRDGQRYTAKRRQLVDVLAEAEQPVTIPDIVRAHPALPQSSVYRNLAVLERAGTVHRIVGTDEFARFELAEDLTEHHHHHLICSACGAVEDFTLSDELEHTVERALHRIARRRGFDTRSHRLDLVGVCATCS